jgi:hypothetical protein
MMPEGGIRRGLLDRVAKDLALTVGEGGRLDVIRMNVTPLGETDAGVLEARYRAGPAGLDSPVLLRQVALFQRTDSLYFRLDLISPAPTFRADARDTAAVDREVASDPSIRRAVRAFKTVLDGVSFIDQTALWEDQRDRLLRTRSMLVNLKARGRIVDACMGETWWRVIRDGQDVGVARVIEEPADGLPADVKGGFDAAARGTAAAEPLLAEGVRVGVRMRMRTATGAIDRRTWTYASRDLTQADFRESVALYRDGDGEMGSALSAVVVGAMRSKPVPRRVEVDLPGRLGTEVLIEVDNRSRLEVVHSLDGKPRGRPLERDLSPWYIPQAVDHLLPRILPRWGARTYMVAVYAPDRREVMSKYYDVEGPVRRALPPAIARAEMNRAQADGVDRDDPLFFVVSSRLGLSGPPTLHYIDAVDYRWLGSVNDDAGTMVLPATSEEVEAILAGTPMIRE